MTQVINKLKTKAICVFADEGGRIEVYLPSDSKYQFYLKLYNNKNKNKYYG
jgi:hypothetical protein|tara:strand:+ start:795 stop:947 length:153 start_codon:yes stop_codon:yes gene_type:complete